MELLNENGKTYLLGYESVETINGEIFIVKIPKIDLSNSIIRTTGANNNNSCIVIFNVCSNEDDVFFTFTSERCGD